MAAPTDLEVLQCIREEVQSWEDKYEVVVEPQSQFLVREPYSDAEVRVTVPLRGLDQIYGPMFTDIENLSSGLVSYSLNVDSSRAVVYALVIRPRGRARSPSPARRPQARGLGGKGCLWVAVGATVLVAAAAGCAIWLPSLSTLLPTGPFPLEL